MSGTEGMTPAELVAQVRASYGLTWDELGAVMNRSPRMMRKIARGETSGESYRDALTELHQIGAVSRAPKRRRDAAGKLVPVRAKRGAKKATVRPRDARRGPSLTRHSTRVTHLPDGNRIVQIQLPKTVGSPERGAGLHAARTAIVNVARAGRTSACTCAPRWASAAGTRARSMWAPRAGTWPLTWWPMCGTATAGTWAPGSPRRWGTATPPMRLPRVSWWGCP